MVLNDLFPRLQNDEKYNGFACLAGSRYWGNYLMQYKR